MTNEEAIQEFEQAILRECMRTKSPADRHCIELFDMAIEALKQESMLEKIKADLEKLANDEWNTKVGSVSQGLECALEIIEAYQEGR